MSREQTAYEFRRRLSSFTADAAPDACKRSLWPDRLAAISTDLPNTISVVEVEPVPNYTCFTFALGLHESKNHYRIQWHTTRVSREEVFANADFVSHLRRSGILERTHGRDGLIVYLDASARPMHAGRIAAGRVRSKWGTGWLVEHGIWEVPMEYGDDYEIFETPDGQRMETEFIAWAATVRGIDTTTVLSRTKNI